jgi:hypothetical protein
MCAAEIINTQTLMRLTGALGEKICGECWMMQQREPAAPRVCKGQLNLQRALQCTGIGRYCAYSVLVPAGNDKYLRMVSVYQYIGVASATHHYKQMHAIYAQYIGVASAPPMHAIYMTALEMLG